MKFNKILDILYPRRCPVCGDITGGFGRMICPDCLHKLSFVRSPVCKKCGVKNLVVQPTHLMNGLEYTDLVNELAENSDAFEHVAVGEPLLTSDDDFKAVISAITDATKEYDDGETAICFMADLIQCLKYHGGS